MCMKCVWNLCLYLFSVGFLSGCLTEHLPLGRNAHQVWGRGGEILLGCIPVSIFWDVESLEGMYLWLYFDLRVIYRFLTNCDHTWLRPREIDMSSFICQGDTLESSVSTLLPLMKLTVVEFPYCVKYPRVYVCFGIVVVSVVKWSVWVPRCEYGLPSSGVTLLRVYGREES